MWLWGNSRPCTMPTSAFSKEPGLTVIYTSPPVPLGRWLPSECRSSSSLSRATESFQRPPRWPHWCSVGPPPVLLPFKFNFSLCILIMEDKSVFWIVKPLDQKAIRKVVFIAFSSSSGWVILTSVSFLLTGSVLYLIIHSMMSCVFSRSFYRFGWA